MSARQGPDNLIFIVLDTARADAFAAYGGDGRRTPTFTRLANDGFVAPQAFASSSWTLPSHVGMLFGDHHRALGLSKQHQNGQHAGAVVTRNRDRYLPQVLKSNGYWTVGASANPWLRRGTGFDTGFDEFHDLWRPGQWAHGLGRKARVRRLVRHAVQATADAGIGEAEQLTNRWIARARHESAPGFLFLNLVEFHSPYLPPRPYNDMCMLNRVRTGYQMLTHLDMFAIWRANLAGAIPPPRMLARMRHLYYQTAGFVDAWLARLLEALQDSGLLERTLVVITSDHGENFGEGGRIGHAFSVDHNLIKVPLFLSREPSGSLSQPFSLVNLPAVIAEQLELTDAPWARDRAKAVISDFQGVGDPDDERVTKFLSESKITDAVTAMTADRTTATDGRYKVVRFAGEDRFVDTETDPGEIAGKPIEAVGDELAGVAASLVDALDAFMMREPLDAPPDAADEAPIGDDPDDEALVEQMRLLGYL
ncbi:MAG: sulfatase [Mycobacteriales bacterium]